MLAFYLRLSKADKEVEESNSIQSQRELLQQSLGDYGLLKEEVAEYIDDGYSGKNFDRPGIKRLFSDIEYGRIQVVLVKDFSRFGRNYKKVSDYIEKRFLEKGIRFIAVNNGYDRNPNDAVICNGFNRQSDSGICMIQNILDDYSSEEGSKKIKQALLQRRKEGNYLAPFAPYGYKKDMIDPKHLVIDLEAAEIVRLIFQMHSEGKSGGEIARYLNSRQIPSPLDYRNGKEGEHIWQSEVIWAILHNREYLGNLVIGKYQTVQTGSRKRRKTTTDQWIEIKGTHQAIIEKEQFELVQIKEYQQKEGKKREEEKIKDSFFFHLKGMVVCGGCGHKMKRKGQKSSYFFCKYYYYNRNPLCIKSGIKEEQLFKIIEQVLEKNVHGFHRASSYRQYQNYNQRKRESWRAEQERLERRRKAERYFFYESWKSGRICEGDYNKKIEEQKQKYKRIPKKEIQNLEEPIFFAGFLREIIIEILVFSYGKIMIRFRMRKG